MSEFALAPISTNVRVQPPATARAAFWLAQRAGTTFAAALLERFFLTPRRSGLSMEETAFLATGRAEHLDAEAGGLAVWTWGEGETVLLAHGWGSRAARYRTIAPALVAAGFRVVAFDAPGHGVSSGRRSSLPETARAIRSIAKREYARRGAWPRALIAHSFGCAAAIMAQGQGVRFRRNVLLSPAADFDGYMDRVAHALAISPEVVSAMIRRVERRFNFCWDGIRLDRVAARLNTRALIFHDPADAEVPFSDAQLLHRSFAAAELVMLSGLGHRRLLHDPEVVRRIIDFV